MRKFIIERHLEQLLANTVRIELRLAERPELASFQPGRLEVSLEGRPPRALPGANRIEEVFDELGGALLIVGAPGAGKTTLLLELAKALAERAANDDEATVPLRLSLASWAARRGSLAEWIVAELQDQFQVAPQLARSWVESERILPLLDGLDEVPDAARDACAAAINKFRAEHGLLPIVVASRAADYEALRAKLNLPAAVAITPLSAGEVRGYVTALALRLDGLAAALDEDPSLHELLNTPLMLGIATLAFADQPVSGLVGLSSTTAKQAVLFDTYARVMFARKRGFGSHRFERVQAWLAALAAGMRGTQQSEFRLDSLPEFLRGRRRDRIALWLTEAVLCLLVCFCITSLTSLIMHSLLWNALQCYRICPV